MSSGYGYGRKVVQFGYLFFFAKERPPKREGGGRCVCVSGLSVLDPDEVVVVMKIKSHTIGT